MRLKIYLPFCFIAISLLGLAQPAIPNASFETWGANPPFVNTPVGWQTDAYTLFPKLMAKDSDAHSGNYSVKIGCQLSDTTMLLGEINIEFGYTPANPISFLAWVKTALVGSDKGFLSAECYKYDSLNTLVNGAMTFDSSTNSSSWKQLVLPLVHRNTLTDSTVILISMNNATDTNSYFLVDDVSFSETEVSAIAPAESLAAEKLYPNPANNIENLVYSLNRGAQVSLEVYNIQGERMETVLSEQQSAGRYRVEIPTDKLASGIYITTLQSNGEVLHNKFMVQH